MFLPDRFIPGDLPALQAAGPVRRLEQSCGATFSPTDLIDAVSVVSGARPVQRQSEHLFFQLGDFSDMLWAGRQPAPAGDPNKLEEWFSAGLRDWDISRDAPTGDSRSRTRRQVLLRVARRADRLHGPRSSWIP